MDSINHLVWDTEEMDIILVRQPQSVGALAALESGERL